MDSAALYHIFTCAIGRVIESGKGQRLMDMGGGGGGVSGFREAYFKIPRRVDVDLCLYFKKLYFRW